MKGLLRRLDSDAGAAVVLGAAAVLGLVWANIGSTYDRFWEAGAGFAAGGFTLSMSLGEWVNNGVMTLFFFSVGLDVRREFAIGELQDRARAVLPVAGAVGGLVVPVGVFLLVLRGADGAGAWGSVISTDTAFALGMLALVGPRHGARLRVFLLTLAVVDDIGALAVIAVFYSTDLHLAWLGVVAAGLVLVWLMQRHDVWRVAPYLAIGLVVWYATLRSGVDATLAGVLVALIMPVYLTRPRDVVSATLQARWYRQAPAPHSARMARRTIARSVPLNQRLSELLAPYVNFGVVPLFAVANVGIHLDGATLGAAASSRLTWGVVAGLVIGKFLGVFGGASLARRLVPGSRVPGLDGPRLAGLAALTGMGFTISLLVVDIAVPDPLLADEARVGVLLASVLALGVAALVFRVTDRVVPLPEPAGRRLERPVSAVRDHVRGRLDAPAVLVVQTPMNDRYRLGTAVALADAQDRLGDELAVVFRHHATTDEELTAALALEAAADQGRFWELYDAIVEVRQPLAEVDPEQLMVRADVDVDRLTRDVMSQKQQARVDEDNLDATAGGLPERTALFLNGKRFTEPADSFHLVGAVRRELDQLDHPTT